MADIKDLDLTGLIKAKGNAPLGDAHELFVRAIMMRLGFEVGKIDLSGSPFDIVVIGFTEPNGRKKVFLKVQVKTISDASLTLKGGSRGGIDREYKSGVKEYKYTEEHSDLIFGVERDSLDIYLFPTRFANKFNTSVSKSKIEICKNNWEILRNWNTDYLDKEIGNKIKFS